jgi:hypothetical protein
VNRTAILGDIATGEVRARYRWITVKQPSKDNVQKLNSGGNT